MTVGNAYLVLQSQEIYNDIRFLVKLLDQARSTSYWSVCGGSNLGKTRAKSEQ